MLQHDVFPNPIARLRGLRPFLVVLQSDILRIETRHVVAPLLTVGAVKEVARLTPRINVDGTDYVFFPMDIGSMPSGILKDPIVNLAHERDRLLAALDMLFTGI